MSGGWPDFTHVATWSGIVHVAFVVDVFSRAIVGWSAATSKRAKLVLDALDTALWHRDRAGTPAGPGLIHHTDAGSQTTSFTFTAQLLDAGIDASIATDGDALDNALVESQIGLYKTELIKPRKPWHGLADIELATAEWVDWFNNQRLHTAIGDIPPHEHETNSDPGALQCRRYWGATAPTEARSATSSPSQPPTRGPRNTTMTPKSGNSTSR